MRPLYCRTQQPSHDANPSYRSIVLNHRLLRGGRLAAMGRTASRNVRTAGTSPPSGTSGSSSRAAEHGCRPRPRTFAGWPAWDPPATDRPLWPTARFCATIMARAGKAIPARRGFGLSALFRPERWAFPLAALRKSSPRAEPKIIPSRASVARPWSREIASGSPPTVARSSVSIRQTVARASSPSAITAKMAVPRQPRDEPKILWIFVRAIN